MALLFHIGLVRRCDINFHEILCIFDAVDDVIFFFFSA